VARFLPAAAVCGVYCLGFHRRESVEVVRRHWRRLLAGAVMAVPAYNLALYYGQQHGVPAPIASLTTTLLPLMVMTLAMIVLHEPLTRNRVLGFVVAGAGMGLVAFARRGEMGGTYPLTVAITALAPLSWSIYTVLSKPLAHRVPPLLWTYLSVALGGLLVLPLLPGPVWAQCRALDTAGWAAVLYLTFPCTVLGFAVWTWLLKHLPASSVGFTVFLNPPLTAVSKFLLATALPAVFVFHVTPQELAGGALALVGLLIAVAPRPRRPRGAWRARSRGAGPGSFPRRSA
jgi:drug/metabolite transporter (DMT)-like permease